MFWHPITGTAAKPNPAFVATNPFNPEIVVAARPIAWGKTVASPAWATHPEVVRAVGELVRDSGAGQIYIADRVYDTLTYPNWGYEDIASNLNATLVDLNLPDP